MPDHMEPCAWTRDRMEPYLDAELPDAVRAALEAHCSSCAACARELSLAIRIRAGLRSLPVYGVPAHVLEQSAREIDGASSNVIPLRARGARGRLVLPAVAAALLVVAAALWMGTTRRHAGDYSEAEILEARAGMAMAFGYVDRYSRGVVAADVLGKRVVPRIERAVRGTDVTSPPPTRS